MYRKLDGVGYYVRPKSWWHDLRARICITTTEAHVAAVAKSMQDGAGIPSFRVHHFDNPACFPIDAVPLRLDWAARKDDIADLATQLATDRDDPVDLVITDMAKGPFTMTHDGARGRNDLSGASQT